MKSKYCFIRNLSSLHVGSFIYQVWVGSSLRELATLSQVEQICSEQGYFIEKYSQLVHSKICRARERFIKNGYAIADPFRAASISISKLLEVLRNHSFDDFENSIIPTPQEIWYRHHHDLDFIQNYNAKKSNTSCLPSVRKYLSHS